MLIGNCAPGLVSSHSSSIMLPDCLVTLWFFQSTCLPAPDQQFLNSGLPDLLASPVLWSPAFSYMTLPLSSPIWTHLVSWTFIFLDVVYFPSLSPDPVCTFPIFRLKTQTWEQHWHPHLVQHICEIQLFAFFPSLFLAWCSSHNKCRIHFHWASTYRPSLFIQPCLVMLLFRQSTQLELLSVKNIKLYQVTITMTNMFTFPSKIYTA